MFKARKKQLPPVAAVILCALLPLLFSGNSYIVLLFCTIGIYVIAVNGLDLLFGYAGQISMGHAAFYAIGAYGSALLSLRCGISPFITVPLGGILAALSGALLALPASKLVYHFLSLLTIAFNMLVYNLVANVFTGLTGGHVGIGGIPTFTVGPFSFHSRTSYFYIILVVVVLLLGAKQRIVNSRTGRAMISLRENLSAANGMGVNVHFYKVLAFAISAFYTGVAGGLYAHLVGYISPDTFTQAQSTVFLTMMLLGGSGSLLGPIIGVVVLKVITEVLQDFSSYQTLVYGIFILITVIFMPGGIYGLCRSWVKKLWKRREVAKDAAPSR